MIEHTQGPWKVVGLSVISDSGIICNPPSGAIGELEANARLIAAAPDMLDELDEWHTYLFESGHLAKAEQVMALIAKAKGE